MDLAQLVGELVIDLVERESPPNFGRREVDVEASQCRSNCTLDILPAMPGGLAKVGQCEQPIERAWRIVIGGEALDDRIAGFPWHQTGRDRDAAHPQETIEQL